jgi:large subunit ribosomal protein L20
MPRIRKGAARTKARRRTLRAARGYWGTKHRHKQQAKVALWRAGQFAYRDRRARRRDFRRLWITRITAACRMRGTRYSRFINGLQHAGVLLNRKMLSQIAIENPATFDRLVEMADASSTAHGGNGSPGGASATTEPKTRTAERPVEVPA